jgi:hypothetical protein
MNRDALLAKLRADASCDAAVVCIGEADYGCEERADNAPALVWLLLLTRDGVEQSLELPESRLNALGLHEGDLCTLAELHG